MSDDIAKLNLLNLNRSSIIRLVERLGESPSAGNRLIRAIHKQGIVDFFAMSDLSKNFQNKLNDIAEIVVPTVIKDQTSEDGTRKWLLQLDGGNAIEMVFIPEANRGTLCISSQIGCALNCSFCSTGKQGFNRDLSLAEIIGQLWIATRHLSPQGLDKQRVITNVVMMGMGEPLLNYQPVVDAMDWMLCDDSYGLSKYRVTLSTSGVIPKIEQLKKDSPVSLAISLHAPTNDLRTQLVPLNKKYPLEQLIPVCRNYFPENSKQSVLFEYVMLDGVNDSLEHAAELIALLQGVTCKINLIPFNPFPGTTYRVSSCEAIDAFHAALVNAGFQTRVRRRRGDRIDAACGQLAGQFYDRTGRKVRLTRKNAVIH